MTNDPTTGGYTARCPECGRIYEPHLGACEWCAYAAEHDGAMPPAEWGPYRLRDDGWYVLEPPRACPSCGRIYEPHLGACEYCRADRDRNERETTMHEQPTRPTRRLISFSTFKRHCVHLGMADRERCYAQPLTPPCNAANCPTWKRLSTPTADVVANSTTAQ